MTEQESYSGMHRELTERIIGAFYSVANELGTGFLESVYRRALCIELRERGMKAQEEVEIPVIFHGYSVGIFRADIIVNELVVLELKTAEDVAKAYEAQLLHYLRATELEVGLLLVFGTRAQCRRSSISNAVKRGLKNRNTDDGGIMTG